MYNHTLGDTFFFRVRDTTEECTGLREFTSDAIIA